MAGSHVPLVEVSECGRSDRGLLAAPAVSLHRVVKTYGNRRIVDSLTLEIPQGICLSLLGPNGAGKSTTMRMLIGQTLADSGTITILGHPIPARSKEARAHIGLVPQGDNLDTDITVRQNLDVFAAWYRVPRRRRAAAVDHALAIAQLESRADTRVTHLSGGMRRRLLIARALVHRPRIVLLDEPTVGLDPQVRQDIWRILAGLRAEGSTIVMTTHYIEEAERLADWVAVMSAGSIIAEGSPSDLITSHAGREVHEYHGLSAHQVGQLRQVVLRHGLRVRRSGPAISVLRAEDLPAVGGSLPPPRLRRPATLEDVFIALTGEEAPE